ncbi:MAG: family 16 glycoside hydrolase, partial [Candidatus Poribacteria bacterium]
MILQNFARFSMMSALAVFLVTLMLLVDSALAGTFRDDFEDGNLNGWEEFDLGRDGKVEEKGGELVVTDTNRSFVTLAFFNNGQILKDFTLIFDAKMAKAIANFDPYMWIVFRFNFGAWGVNAYGPGDPKNTWLYVFQPIQLFGTAKFPLVFRVDRWYRIKLEMKGVQVTLWVDGKLMGKVNWENQPLPKSGQVGLGGGGVEVHFDNFVITGDEVSDGGPGGFAVAP